MIRRFLSLFAALMIAALASAQIPNPSFENWTDGQPDGWATSNFPPLVTSVTPFQPAAAGTWALQAEVASFLGLGNLPAFVQATFPYTEQPGELTGSYMFTAVGGDSMYIVVELLNQAGVIPVAIGELLPPPTGSTYQSFSVPLQYINQGTIPDTAYVWFGITGEDTVHLGSRMVIDNLAFSGSATSVGDEPGVPGAFSLEQNYPNPFNPSTSVRYTLPAAGRATLTVSNLLGENVATVVDEEQPAGSYEVRFDAAGLPSGLYFYTLRSGSFTETRRMMLLK